MKRPGFGVGIILGHGHGHGLGLGLTDRLGLGLRGRDDRRVGLGLRGSDLGGLAGWRRTREGDDGRREIFRELRRELLIPNDLDERRYARDRAVLLAPRDDVLGREEAEVRKARAELSDGRGIEVEVGGVGHRSRGPPLRTGQASAS